MFGCHIVIRHYNEGEYSPSTNPSIRQMAKEDTVGHLQQFILRSSERIKRGRFPIQFRFILNSSIGRKVCEEFVNGLSKDANRTDIHLHIYVYKYGDKNLSHEGCLRCRQSIWILLCRFTNPISFNHKLQNEREE